MAQFLLKPCGISHPRLYVPRKKGNHFNPFFFLPVVLYCKCWGGSVFLLLSFLFPKRYLLQLSVCPCLTLKQKGYIQPMSLLVSLVCSSNGSVYSWWNLSHRSVWMTVVDGVYLKQQPVSGDLCLRCSHHSASSRWVETMTTKVPQHITGSTGSC